LNSISKDMKAASRGVSKIRDRVAALRDVVVRYHGYRGDADTYDDMQNANLMRVIDRRKGIPVALGILIIHAARSRRWQIAGLNFPGHFLLRLSLNGETAVIDPFDQCHRLTMEDLKDLVEQMHGDSVPMHRDFVRSVGNRDILIRLQNNIKLRALSENNNNRAIELLETMTAIAPGDASLWHERAVLEAGRGNVQSAVRTLENFLANAGEGADGLNVGRTERLLSRLRRELN
ncbi:MAG: transglutaminase-like domain-containing protein, partial [Proteobacteria bacterium]|nr:transglutaminase-like domain-containing protein [Pseudomonadota bacterium]